MTTPLDDLVMQMYKGGILYYEALAEFKKAFVVAVLQDHRGNISKAAPKLGLHRNTLTRLASELNLDLRVFRSVRRPPASVPSAYGEKKASR